MTKTKGRVILLVGVSFFIGGAFLVSVNACGGIAISSIGAVLVVALAEALARQKVNMTPSQKRAAFEETDG